MKKYIINILPLLAMWLTSLVTSAQLVRNSYNGEAEISAPNSVVLAPGFHATGTVRIFTTGTTFRNCMPLSSTASSNQNYILTRTFKQAGVTSANINDARGLCDEGRVVQYFDGLGRPIQTVSVQASPLGHDIVQPMAYDAFGREAKKYLPYAATGGNGSYRTNAISEQLGFYTASGINSGDQMAGGIVRIPTPFAETLFEASPLNRVLQQGAPGDAWQLGSGHTIRTDQGTNATGEVRLWTVTTGGATTSTNYQAGKLYKTTTRDENWKDGDGKMGSMEEFKDLEGRVVLKRTWETAAKGLSTYYLYDDLGNLRYVLPPALNENGANITSLIDDDANFNKYAYAYRYDGRKRLIEKKVPGKGWEYMVYNKLDQVVLAQDANQRTTNKWAYTKYDALGRVVATGLYTDARSRSDLQGNVLNVQTVLWEAFTGADYDGASFPQSGGDILTTNYYDGYAFTGNTFGPPTGGQAPTERTRGLLTGSKVKVLGTGTMLLKVSYYDLEGRVVQTRAQNHLGGTDVVDNSYNFAGELIATKRTHTANGATTTIANRYEYDHAGRKLATFQNINDKGEVALSHLSYNELGQLVQKGLHNDAQTTGYAYNERGWLQGNTSEQFSMHLRYNDGTAPQYNGNISGQLWGAGNNLPNTYAYGYDRLNRLTDATSTGINMKEVLTYDLMGNISTLNRDNLGNSTYSYTGNQLTGISGNSIPMATTYSYDANGNATTDGRNGMVLSYNHLNLPQTASKTGISLTYTYDATGRKLTKSSNGTLRHYVDGIEYDGNVIDLIHTEEGVAQHNGSNNYTYHYNLSDHLGNVRYTFDIYNGAVRRLQQDDYYAFGKRKAVEPVGNNRYLYNGKELQDELGQYDYGARFYDPAIARFTSIDPIAEHFPWMTNYQYASNDPIKNIDLDGLEGLPFFLLGNNSVVPRIAPLAEASTKYSTENIAKAGGEFTGKTLESFRRGNATEAEQLTKRGLEKNYRPLNEIDPKTGKGGRTIPDALDNDGQSTVEVKHVTRQSLTKQLRLQEKFSNDNGFNPELIINKGAELSNPLKKSSFKITRYDVIKPLGVDNVKVVIPNSNKPITPPPPPKDDPRWL